MALLICISQQHITYCDMQSVVGSYLFCYHIINRVIKSDVAKLMMQSGLMWQDACYYSFDITRMISSNSQNQGQQNENFVRC